MNFIDKDYIKLLCFILAFSNEIVVIIISCKELLVTLSVLSTKVNSKIIKLRIDKLMIIKNGKGGPIKILMDTLNFIVNKILKCNV